LDRPEKVRVRKSKEIPRLWHDSTTVVRIVRHVMRAVVAVLAEPYE